MSKHHMEKLTCPSCHHDGDFEVWDSINTVLDPEMKEKVLNQSILNRTVPASIFLIMIQSPAPYLWLYNHPESTLSVSFLRK